MLLGNPYVSKSPDRSSVGQPEGVALGELPKPKLPAVLCAGIPHDFPKVTRKVTERYKPGV